MKKKTYSFVLVLMTAILTNIDAQVLIDNSTSFTYTQNFDSLPTSGTNNTWTDNSTIPSWYSSSTTIRAGTGSAATSGLYSFGINSTSTDRSLGFLSSGSAGGNFSVILLNNSGSAIQLTNIQISFAGEQWRANTNNSTLVFGYRTSATPITDSTSGSYTLNSNFNFTSPTLGSGNAVDGNLAANRQVFTSSAVDSSGTLNSGDYLALRWNRSTQANGAGLGIDDFQLNVIPEPSTWALIGLGSAFVLWRVRSRKKSF